MLVVRKDEFVQPIHCPFSTSHQTFPSAVLSHGPVAVIVAPFGRANCAALAVVGSKRMLRPLSGSLAVMPVTITTTKGLPGGTSAAEHPACASVGMVELDGVLAAGATVVALPVVVVV